MSPKAKLASLLGAVRSSKGRALGWWLLCLWGTRILGSELGGLHVLILGYIDWATSGLNFLGFSYTSSAPRVFRVPDQNDQETKISVGLLRPFWFQWGFCRCFTTDSLPRGYPGQYVWASAYVELDG